MARGWHGRDECGLGPDSDGRQLSRRRGPSGLGTCLLASSERRGRFYGLLFFLTSSYDGSIRILCWLRRAPPQRQQPSWPLPHL